MTSMQVTHDDQVTGGMVSEVLTLIAAGTLDLRPAQVKVSPN